MSRSLLILLVLSAACRVDDSEDCGNGVDDDGDGLTDCLDAECNEDAACGADVDTSADTEPDTDVGSEPDTEADTEADTEPDTEADTEADTELDTEADTEPDTEPDTEADTEPDTEADTTPPGPLELQSIVPDGAASWPADADFVLTFDRAIDPLTLVPSSSLAGTCSGTILLGADTGDCLPAEVVSVESGNTVVTLAAVPGLSLASSYSITVTTGVEGMDGTTLVGDQTALFTIEASDVVLNETGDPLEADFCNVQFPLSFDATPADTTTVYAQIYEAGTTEASGAPGTITAQIGWGSRDINPQHETGWTWIDASYNVQSGNNDEFQADLATLPLGSWAYASRFSLDGTTWTYCDADGSGSLPDLEFDMRDVGVATISE